MRSLILQSQKELKVELLLEVAKSHLIYEESESENPGL